jgi:hypothetical protein
VRRVLFIALICACEVQLEPRDEPAGDSTEVPALVQQIFDDSCATAGCHGDGSPAAGLSLAADRSSAALAGTSTQRPELALVTFGEPTQSYLALKLLPDDDGRAAGTARMPAGGELDPVELAIVIGWIGGAPLEEPQ